MEQLKIVIKRVSAIIACGKTYKLELDGVIVGKLKNGGMIEIPIDVGKHILRFIAFGKCEKSINIIISEETETIHINTKISNISGNIELQTNNTQNIIKSNNEGDLKQNKSTLPVSAVIAITVIVIVVTIFSIICAIPFSSNSENSISATFQEENQKTNEKVVYSDEHAKITYLGIDDPKTGLAIFTMSIKVENNFDKNAFIMLNEGYINDMAVQFFGGNISYEGIKPNKSAVCVFTFGYDKLGITKLDDINKVEFKIKLTNPDDFSDVLLETDTITLFKE